MENLVICLATLAAFLFGGFAAERFGAYLDTVRKGPPPAKGKRPAAEKRKSASQ